MYKLVIRDSHKRCVTLAKCWCVQSGLVSPSKQSDASILPGEEQKKRELQLMLALEAPVHS